MDSEEENNHWLLCYEVLILEERRLLRIVSDNRRDTVINITSSYNTLDIRCVSIHNAAYTGHRWACTCSRCSNLVLTPIEDHD
ncbi:hypothetical protein TNCV_2196851 [Trichonephila clavipes]|nr:hypothetical protein TNCV_2196851 [Trichonephila clavipes]